MLALDWNVGPQKNSGLCHDSLLVCYVQCLKLLIKFFVCDLSLFHPKRRHPHRVTQLKILSTPLQSRNLQQLLSLRSQQKYWLRMTGKAETSQTYISTSNNKRWWRNSTRKRNRCCLMLWLRGTNSFRCWENWVTVDFAHGRINIDSTLMYHV